MWLSVKCGDEGIGSQLHDMPFAHHSVSIAAASLVVTWA